MNNSILIIKGENKFSVRLAHAKAATLALKNISTINFDDLSFTFQTNGSVFRSKAERDFIQWCESVTVIKYNKIGLMVVIPEALSIKKRIANA